MEAVVVKLSEADIKEYIYVVTKNNILLAQFKSSETNIDDGKSAAAVLLSNKLSLFVNALQNSRFLSLIEVTFVWF